MNICFKNIIILMCVCLWSCLCFPYFLPTILLVIIEHKEISSALRFKPTFQFLVFRPHSIFFFILLYSFSLNYEKGEIVELLVFQKAIFFDLTNFMHSCSHPFKLSIYLSISLHSVSLKMFLLRKSYFSQT